MTQRLRRVRRNRRKTPRRSRHGKSVKHLDTNARTRRLVPVRRYRRRKNKRKKAKVYAPTHRKTRSKKVVRTTKVLGTPTRPPYRRHENRAVRQAPKATAPNVNHANCIRRHKSFTALANYMGRGRSGAGRMRRKSRPGRHVC